MSDPVVALVPSSPAPLGLVRPAAPVAQVVEAHKEIVELIRQALEEGRDYGPMPGEKLKKEQAPRMVLFKAGAERLAVAFGASATYSIVEKEIDHDRAVRWRKKKWVDGANGRRQETEINGESRGLYRYVIRAQLVRPDGRVLGEGIGSCSTLEGKYIDRPRECENTCLKMAEKRALVAAALGAFGLSDRFTQDVEEGPPPAVEAPRRKSVV